MRRGCFILLILSIVAGCDSKKPIVKGQNEKTYSPSDFQWIALSQIDQLLHDPNYFQPLIFAHEALDSFQKKHINLYTEINNEPGYRFHRKIYFVYDKGRLKQMKEELLYNHKSIHKRMFTYSYKNTALIPPVVTNETKKISLIIKQFFGLGATAVEMVGLADFHYEVINDSVIFKKSLIPNYSVEEVYLNSHNGFIDTLNYGVILSIGRPINWCEKEIKTPFFNWIPIHANVFDSLTGMPLKSKYLSHGNTISRSFLYREDGLFVKAIDSIFYDDTFLRTRQLKLTYDSTGLPAQMDVFFENKNGEKIPQRKHLVEWIK